MSRRGFSLIELAMVLAVTGLMTSFMLQATQSSSTKDCYASTKEQVQTIRQSLERYARSNDRLPLPAARNLGVESPKYGRETIPADIANIDQPGTVSWGALPFQALGLPASMAGDCWGNKFTYVVTATLTTTAGYGNAANLGTIELKTSSGPATSTELAYAVISHGEDQLGAVKINHSTTKGWCAGATLKHTNCTATAAIAAGAAFNNGKDAGADYFDDVVTAAQKPQIFDDILSNTFCWGWGAYGQLGNAANSDTSIPVRVKGPHQFTDISMDRLRACGVTTAGKVYCWGASPLGNGTSNSSNVPVAIDSNLAFKAVSVGDDGGCALTTAGAAYCWGYICSAYGYDCVSPTLLPGGHVFDNISFGFSTAMGVTTTGEGYVWSNSSYTPQLISPTIVFREIKMSLMHYCGVDVNDDLYCWGWNQNGELGSTMAGPNCNLYNLYGNMRYYCDAPQLVEGGWKFKKFGVASSQTCGIDASNDGYCWGEGSGVGNGWANFYSSTPITGGLKLQSIDGNGGGGICALNMTGESYCWGAGGSGQLGGGWNTGMYGGITSNPVAVDKSLVVDYSKLGHGPGSAYSYSNMEGISCGIALTTVP